MAKVRYAIIGFGGIAENRVAKEGYACDKKRFKPLKKAVLTGAMPYMWRRTTHHTPSLPSPR